MWTCTKCNTEVEDQFENCPACGTGRNGSEPPVNHVTQKDALQPKLPTAHEPDPRNKGKLISVIIVLAVIALLLFIAFSG